MITSVNLDTQSKAILDALAEQSDRSRSYILRRLIRRAAGTGLALEEKSPTADTVGPGAEGQTSATKGGGENSPTDLPNGLSM